MARCDSCLFLYLFLPDEPAPVPFTFVSLAPDDAPELLAPLLAMAGELFEDEELELEAGEACEVVAVAVAAAMAVAFMVMLMLMLVWLLDELEGRKAVVLPFAADEERWWW